MEQYIPKTALVAEIKTRIETYNKGYANGDDCRADALETFLHDIDFLEVKEVDFEKETKRWWKEYLHLNPENKLWMDAHQSVVFAKHFYELGLKAQKGE